MSASKRTRMEPGEIVLTIAGLVMLGLGVARFVAMRHFTLGDAGYCIAASLGAFFLLLVATYTLHHARVALLIVVFLMVVLAWKSPAFCVGLGIALLGILAEQRSKLTALF